LTVAAAFGQEAARPEDEARLAVMWANGNLQFDPDLPGRPVVGVHLNVIGDIDPAVRQLGVFRHIRLLVLNGQDITPPLIRRLQRQAPVWPQERKTR